MKNDADSLSDLYNQILNEGKDDVVVTKDAMKISKDGKVPVATKTGATGKKAEGEEEAEEAPAELNSNCCRESAKPNSFEAIYNTILNEEDMASKPEDKEPMDLENKEEEEVEVPEESEGLEDEMAETEDEVSDLVSDLKQVQELIQSILDKVADATGEAEEVEGEVADEEGELEDEDGALGMNPDTEVSEEDYDEFKESLKLGTCLADSKGKTLTMKKKGTAGKIKPKKGMAKVGTPNCKPEMKKMKEVSPCCLGPKKKPIIKSTVTGSSKGDFFQ